MIHTAGCWLRKRREARGHQHGQCPCRCHYHCGDEICTEHPG